MIRIRPSILASSVLLVVLGSRAAGMYEGTGQNPPGDDEGATAPIAIGAMAALYFFNPLVVYQDRTVDAGLTKEFSVGFGNFGEHRLGVEYSLILRSQHKHNLRLSYQYDFLLKSGLQPSNMFQGTSVLSVGIGYFTDFERNGYFPEIAYGYSIRNDKLLIFPHLKLRYTFLRDTHGAADFSFGIMVGIANPFIDLHIRNPHQHGAESQ